MFEPLLGFTDPNCTGQTDIRTDIFCMKTPSSSVQREQQKKLKLWNFLSIPIDAQPRGGNRQTAKRFCIHWTILLPCCWTFSKRFTVQARPQPSWGRGLEPCVEHFFKAFYGSPPAQLGARPPCDKPKPSVKLVQSCVLHFELIILRISSK